MQLKLSTSLYYPITVTELLKKTGDEVNQGDALFAYFYRTTVTEGDGLGNRVEVLREFPTRFESTVDGMMIAWKIHKGQVIDGPVAVAEIDEPCAHEVQFGGMCANCGKDMMHASYNTDVLDSQRAPIRMVHDNSALTVSESEATRAEEDAKRRLLAARRLSLVVDLDQTIIHATVDPTVAEWQQDKDSPNHEAVKDVRCFQLVDDGPGMRGCWYYIKLRPGLEEFLKVVSALYELHIYTMGTRAYAQNVANIVDPDRKIFGDRILSRDESGSLTAKNLHRLFPVDTKMVVIIDDRGDVWKWSENLIKVTPYDFFVGIGDINSSWLPKKQELKARTPKPGSKAKKLIAAAVEGGSAKEEANGSKDSAGTAAAGDSTKSAAEVSTLEQLVTMGGGDNPDLLQEQASQQEEAIAHQVEERPLLQKQKALDAEDEAAESQQSAENGDSSSDESQDSVKHHRHHLLEDSDGELPQLQERLQLIHQRFFEEYDRKRTQALGGRVTALKGQRAPSKDKAVDLQIVPDVKQLMPKIKRAALESVVLVFSGVLPLGTDMQNADISLWAKSFGATITAKINSRTTHLVAGRNRTAKVREATRYPKIKIVTVQWLVECMTQWKHMDEEPFLVPVHPDDRGEPISPDEAAAKENAEDSLLSSLSDDEDESDGESDESSTSRLARKRRNSEEQIRLSAGLTDHSRLGYDEQEQATVHDELKEFLGSDNEDSESDTDFSMLFPERKRKREDIPSDSEQPQQQQQQGTGSEEAGGSRLAQRIKRSHERMTGLKEVETQAPLEPTTDTEMEVGKAVLMGEQQSEEQEPRYKDLDPDVDDPEDDEDMLEREMLAAFDDDEGWDEELAADEEGAN